MHPHRYRKTLVTDLVKKNVPIIVLYGIPCYNDHGKTKELRRLSSTAGGANPLDERKEGLSMYVTYSDLIQIGIFICALVGLCYTLFKGKRK